MICPMCNHRMIWNADFDFEDYGIEGSGMISEYSCSNCSVDITIYIPDEPVREGIKDVKNIRC